jgi:hypothetical protein
MKTNNKVAKLGLLLLKQQKTPAPIKGTRVTRVTTLVDSKKTVHLEKNLTVFTESTY